MSPSVLVEFLKEIKGLNSGAEKAPDWPEMLKDSPRLKDLDLPKGSVVLVRGDIDSKKLDKEKLDSQKDTLQFCIQKGWKVILMGHRNRPTPDDQRAFHSKGEVKPSFLFDPEIRNYLSELVGKPFKYVKYWLKEDGSAFTAEFYEVFKALQSGEVLMLENERMWDFLWNELWEAEDDANLMNLANRYQKLGQELTEKIGVKAHINDAASDAKNINFSTIAILPYMPKAVMGFHFERDFEKIKEARAAKLVCFSGAKLDKVKKLKKIVKRGYVETVITGGLVALPFIKAEGRRQSKKISLGAVEDPAMEKENRELYISPEIIGYAEEIYKIIDEKKLAVKIVNPLDFKLDDGTITVDRNIPSGRQQWDIGPKSIEQIKKVTADYLSRHQKASEKPPVFLNGFLGRREMEGFSAGTEAWAAEVRKLAEAGFKIITAGGEGRQVYSGATVIISGGTTLEGMGVGSIPALHAIWRCNQK